MTDLATTHLTFPDDGDEFQKMYLDKQKHQDLIELHRVLSRAIQAQATRKELRDHGLLAYDAIELFKKLSQSRDRLFHAAVQDFTSLVASQQRELCAQIFIKAPDAQEEDYIRHAPEPHLYEKGQFLRLSHWWQSLPPEALRDTVTRFADYFGPIPDNDCFGYNATCAWENLSVGERQQIYDFYHSNQTSHE